MNKAELIAAIAEKAELSKKDAEKALKAFTDVVHAEAQNSEIKLTDLISALSKDLSSAIEKAGYNVVIIDNVFDQIVNIAKT